MPDQTKTASKRARKRAASNVIHEIWIKKREAYFDLLVSGCSIEQIASHTKKNAAAASLAVGQALAKRRLDAREDYVRLQIAWLTRALRCADVSLKQRELKAIAPFVKIVRELNLHQGIHAGPTPPTLSARAKIAPTSPPLALTHSPSVTVEIR
jgi:hypothetical protein